MGLQTSDSFSISAWMNCVWNGGARLSFVGIYGPATDTALGAPVTAVQMGTGAGAGDLVCWTWGGAAVVSSANAAMTPFNNTWVNIVYTYDGITHRMYRNGTLLASQLNSVAPQIPGFLNQVYINGFPGGATSEVAAFQVDQYSLFRRTLSPDEILSMYNAAGARHGIMLGQICRFEFDEGTQGAGVTSVVDMANAGHGLTSIGAGTTFTYTYSSTLANSNIRPVQ
jgi:hypothetical protein